jgi:recombination protein RecA
MYNEGISKTGSLLDLAIEQNVVEKRGAWLSFEGNQLAQGRDAGKEELKNNPELYARVEKALLAKLDGAADSEPAKPEKKSKADDTSAA